MKKNLNFQILSFYHLNYHNLSWISIQHRKSLKKTSFLLFNSSPSVTNNIQKSNALYIGITGSRCYSVSSDFDSAQKRLMTLKESPGNAAKLKLYALFKQSTVGGVNSKRPGMMDFVGRAKWDAWNSLESMTMVMI